MYNLCSSQQSSLNKTFAWAAEELVWFSGQHTCLMLWLSWFESFSSLQFLLCKIFAKRMKRHEKGSDIGTFQNKNTGKIKSLKIEPVLFLYSFRQSRDLQKIDNFKWLPSLIFSARKSLICLINIELCKKSFKIVLQNRSLQWCYN